MSLDRSSVERALPLPPIAARGLVAVIVAVAANAVLLAIGRALFSVPPGFEPMQWRPALLTTAAGAVGGTIVYGLLDRATTRRDSIFLAVAAVVLLVSFIPLVTDFLPRLPATVVGVVALLHVVVAVVTVGSLVDWPPSGDRARG